MMIRLQWRRLRSRYPWLQIVQTWRFWALVLFIVFLILYTVMAFKKNPVPFIRKEIQSIKLGEMEFDFQTGLYFLTENKEVYLRGSMPDSLQENGPPTHCASMNISKEFCAMWRHDIRHPRVKLEVGYSKDQHASCYSVTWEPLTDGHQPQTCFSMADFKWFGGSLLYDQTWPLNSASVPFQPYMTQDLKYYEGKDNVFGNVLDWFWISSAGIAIMVDHSSPMYVSVNQSKDNLICMYANLDRMPSLKYKICKSDNIRKIHRYVISQMVHLPKTLPDAEYFSKPFWSTSSYIHEGLDQNKLHKFGVDINQHEFPGHVLEVNDDALTVYRQKPFDKKMFPNIHQVIMYLHEYKMKIYMPVSSFVPASENWNKSHLILDTNGNPVATTVDDEDVHIINLLSPETFKWFVERLESMKSEFGFDGYRLLRGESEYLTVKNLKPTEINDYILKLSQVMDTLKETCFASFASMTQSGANFIILSSKESSWGTKGGLASVIPSVFTLGVLGYPFIIPNVIGGPGQTVKINTTYTEHKIPERELYIRWMGLSAYMPAMMFSVPPWLYDDEVVEMARTFVKLHQDVVSPLVIKAAREYEISGSPIIRPLWWTDPLDKSLLTISDEYLIGDSLLVAPVIEQGVSSRDIYIPEGTWRDELRGIDVIGKDWLKDYKVELGKVASFTKQVQAI